MKKIVVLVIFILAISLLQAKKLDFSRLKKGDTNVYQLLLRGVITNDSKFQKMKEEFKSEIYLTQVVREVSANSIILQTSIDKEVNYVNDVKTPAVNEGTYYFIEMDKLGNVISQATENNKLKFDTFNSPVFQIFFPKKDLKVGDSWEKLVNFPGTKYRIRVKYRLVGWEKKNGADCAVIESRAYLLGDREDLKLNSKGKIYFNFRDSVVEESIVNSYLSSVSQVSVGGIDTPMRFSMILIVTMKRVR